MRIIRAETITAEVARLCQRANVALRSDVLQSLKRAYERERNKKARGALKAIIDNATIAQRETLAICQDTGLPLVFARIGRDVRIDGDLGSAIQKGVALGYRKGYLRNSIVVDPLARGSSTYGPAVLHTDIIKGDAISLTVMPKGFGCENKSQLRMFNPTVAWPQIRQFIIDAVKMAGPDACPPYVVGVGIGGTADYASLLAKKSLLRRLGSQKAGVSKLEKELLSGINKLAIGPMGLGGGTTALAVHIETYPTHIAGLPVAVNISCHALRSASGWL